MALCGETVKHKVFGKGKIVECAPNRVTILFDGSKVKRKFIYPSAFGKFLELENSALLTKIEEDKKAVAKEIAKKRKIKQERRAELVRMIRVKSLKPTERSNVAFKCNYCDGGKANNKIGFNGVCSDENIKYNVSEAKHIWCSSPESQCFQYRKGEISRQQLVDCYQKEGMICYEAQMLKSWRAYAGVVRSGPNKGEPIRIRNVRPHSLALLTTRLPNVNENERFIFAVFLVDENYLGHKRDEGYVGANPDYRLHLSLAEAKNLKFWDYYFNPNRPEKIIFGSGLHRYMTDIQAAQVLKRICAIKKGTEGEKYAQEFLEYYCRTKALDPNRLPAPEGPLRR